ncbi:30S ribosomal protein S21 [Bradyrhizobium nitroreducens]
MQIFVRDNNVDQALRLLNRKMLREGVFKQMRRALLRETIGGGGTAEI